MTSPLIFIFWMSSVTLAVFGQPGQASCHPEKSKLFDFWIGHWEVYSNGTLAGTNRIEPILNGCGIQENWLGTGGNSGTSLNYYNPVKQQWEQYWVWKQGIPMHLTGNFENGSMILSGVITNQKGIKEKHRVTWTPNSDGTVRQLWEKTSLESQAWQTLFDGSYKKISPQTP